MLKNIHDQLHHLFRTLQLLFARLRPFVFPIFSTSFLPSFLDYGCHYLIRAKITYTMIVDHWNVVQSRVHHCWFLFDQTCNYLCSPRYHGRNTQNWSPKFHLWILCASLCRFWNFWVSFFRSHTSPRTYNSCADLSAIRYLFLSLYL